MYSIFHYDIGFITVINGQKFRYQKISTKALSGFRLIISNLYVQMALRWVQTKKYKSSDFP